MGYVKDTLIILGSLVVVTFWALMVLGAAALPVALVWYLLVTH